EELAYSKTRGLAEDVPAGDIERRLRVGMADERHVHRIVDSISAPWVESEEAWGNLFDPRSNPARMRGNPGRAEWRALAPSFDAGVGRHTDDRRIKASVLPASRQNIDSALVGQVDLKHIDLGYLHWALGG